MQEQHVFHPFAFAYIFTSNCIGLPRTTNETDLTNWVCGLSLPSLKKNMHTFRNYLILTSSCTTCKIYILMSSMVVIESKSYPDPDIANDFSSVGRVVERKCLPEDRQVPGLIPDCLKPKIKLVYVSLFGLRVMVTVIWAINSELLDIDLVYTIKAVENQQQHKTDLNI